MTSLLQNKKILFSLVVILIVIAVVSILKTAIEFNYPLLFPDTRNYIVGAYTGQIPLDRPMIYGLLIRVFSWGYSLWLVVLSQAVFVIFSIGLSLRAFFPQIKGTMIFIMTAFIIIFLSYTTGISVTTAYMLPDIYTPIFLLSIVGLILSKKVKSLEGISFIFLFIISLSAHQSHFPMIFLFLILLSIHLLYKKIKNKEALLKMRGLFLLLALTFFSWMDVGVIHQILGGEFVVSRGSPVFMMGKIAEIGELELFLDERCESSDYPYKLCAHKNEISSGENEFVWNPTSPFYKIGGWQKAQPEFKIILKDFFSTPKYVFSFFVNGIIDGIKLLIGFKAEVYVMNTDDIIPSLLKRYPADEKFILEGQQLRNWNITKELYANAPMPKVQADLSTMNVIQDITVSFFAIVLILFFLSKQFFKVRWQSVLHQRERTLFYVILLLGLVINAWVTGTFAGFRPRYEQRVIWLIPMIGIFASFDLYLLFFSKNNSCEKFKGNHRGDSRDDKSAPSNH